MAPKLTFVHITDSHIGPTHDFEYHGFQPARCLLRLVQAINALPQPPDFVVHTGDVVHDKSPESYAVARALLSQLEVPVFYVDGNHDDQRLLRTVLGAPLHESGYPDAPLDYVFEVKGERFIVLDAHHPLAPDSPIDPGARRLETGYRFTGRVSAEARDPLGILTVEQLNWVENEIWRSRGPLTVLIHYPLFPMGSPWLDQNMIVVNGDELHDRLLVARDRLRGVFLGHLHRSCQVLRDGIVYTSASSTAWQYGWRPWDDMPQLDPDFPPQYNVVQVFDEQVIVQRYTFPYADANGG